MKFKFNIKDKLSRGFKSLKEYLIFLNKRQKSDMILRVASSLSYTSLIALVPLFAVALAIFSAFPMFAEVREQVQYFLLSSVAPNMENDIAEYFNSFISATAQLTTIGVIGIAVTSILLLSTIENSFNFIFKVKNPRRFTTKITLYWTIITLGPLLLGAAFSLKGYFFTIQKMMPESITGSGMVLRAILPSMITWAFLTSVYILVPNKKVRFLEAAIGALITVIAFGILREAFARFVLKGSTYQTLYGAMAVIPVLLVWMYAAWAVVIFGAVVTATLQEFRYDEDKLLKNFEKKGYKKFNKKHIDNRTKIEHVKSRNDKFTNKE